MDKDKQMSTRFLIEAHKQCVNDGKILVKAEEVARALGLSRREGDEIADHLERRGLIEWPVDQAFRLTPAGVNIVEEIATV